MFSGTLGMMWGSEAGLLVFAGCCVLTAADIGFMQGRITARMSVSAKPPNAPTLLDAAAGWGGLAGVGLFLWVLPRFEPLPAAFAVSFFSLIAAWGVSPVPPIRKGGGKPFVVVAAVALLLPAAGLFFHRDLQQYFLKDFYYNLSLSDGVLASFSSAGRYPRVERHRDGYDRVDIVRVPPDALEQEKSLLEAYSGKFVRLPDFPRGYMLFYNGRFITRSDHQEIHAEYLVHIPVILNGRVPARVLVLDLGTGLAARELLKYPGVAEVTQVAFSRTINRLAGEHPLLTYINSRALHDRRVRAVAADGLNFLKEDSRQYDAVYVDLPVPDSYRFSRFYSREFFALVKDHLTPEGYMVFQAPGSGEFSFFNDEGRQEWSDRNKWPVYAKTLQAAGFSTIMPYVSALETDRREAVQGLREFVNAPEGGGGDDLDRTLFGQEARDLVINESVREYVYALQEGFIMAKAGRQKIFTSYRRLQIPLDVLNADRFQRAFRFEYPREENGGRRGSVNTLARPRLPGGWWWDL